MVIFASAKARRLKPNRCATYFVALLITAAAQAQTQPAPTNPPTGGSPGIPAAPPNPPSIVLAPQITVPPAPPPTINVQPAIPTVTIEPPASAPDPTKWLAVAIALVSVIASATIGVVSATIARRNQEIARRSQEIGFRKDAAAILRDIAAKRSTADIQAFENNVARPIGMVLDQIERMVNDMTKLTPVGAAEFGAADERYGALLAADRTNLLRLCAEADGILPSGRPAVFAVAYDRAALDVVLYAAGSQALSGVHQPPPFGAPTAFDDAMTKIAEVKIKLRRLLESERSEQIRLTIGDITTDPFYLWRSAARAGRRFCQPASLTRWVEPRAATG